MEQRAQERIQRAIVGRPWWWLAALLALIALSVFALVDPFTGRPRLELDPSTDSMLPKGDAARAYMEHINDLFGSEETVLLVYATDDVFTPDHLRRIQRLTERIEGLDLVERVSSLSTALNIRAENDLLRIEAFFDEVPEDAEGLADLRRRALEDPIYSGNLVSRDGSASLINVHLLDVTEREMLASGIDDEIVRLAEEESGDAEIWIAGSPHLKAELNRIMIHNLTVIVPLSWLVMGIFAFLVFRTLRGVLIPMVAVQVSTLATMAFVSLVYGQLNLITIAAPPIMMVFGLAYTIHLISAYYDSLRGLFGSWETHREAVGLALREVVMPVLFTGLTTAAGFLSLTTSSLGAIRQFGVFCGIGALVTAFVALTFAPCLLCVLPVPRRVAAQRGRDRFDALLERLAHFDARHRKAILGAGAAVALVALAGIPQIRVSTSNVRDLRADNPVRIHFEKVNQKLEGANAFNVVVEGPQCQAFKDPENLAVLDELQTWIEEQPEVGGTTSLADYLKLINRSFHNDDPEFHAVPESRRLVSQLLLMGANDELDLFIDPEYEVARVTVRTAAIDSHEVRSLSRRIEERLGGVPEHLAAAVTGNTVLLGRTMDDIALGQALSLVVALLIIYTVLALMFTSLRVGLIALIPNALPVLVYFGILGWFGITLNTTTGLVACLVLGIAVDDTIHLMVHFNEASRRHADQTLGVVEALRTVGRPVTYTSIALVLGFLCLLASRMETSAEFGLLSAATLAIAWLIDLTFTPALAYGMRIVTIWDVLSLDLGESPHRSIPLFRGLRHAQARMVALLSSMVSYPAGTLVMRTGDEASEMFVVIDGELAVTTERGGETVHLRTLKRGDLLGEVGVFYGSRSADVRAVSDVRLIRFTQQSVERLARRHPRIATHLYANLSGVLAQRLATVTDRVT